MDSIVPQRTAVVTVSLELTVPPNIATLCLQPAKAPYQRRGQEFIGTRTPGRPPPTDDSDPDIRHRIRALAFRSSPAAAFLPDHLTAATKVHTTHWQTMLRRHVGLPVYDDSVPLTCHHCDRPMDTLRDHATDLCCPGFGRRHRHDSLCHTFATHVTRAAGLDTRHEVSLLVPALSSGPPISLYNPPLSPGRHSVTPYFMCDHGRLAVQGRSSYQGDPDCRWRCSAAAARDKVITLERNLARRLPVPAPYPSSAPNTPNFKFRPLAFDPLGAASPGSIAFIEELVPRIASKCHSTPGVIRRRIHQRLSCTPWSSIAQAIL